MVQHQYDWETLLGRVPAPVDSVAIGRKLVGKAVVVTGAGGFIGSALARGLIAYAPSHLTLIDIGEHGLHDLENAFALAGSAMPPYELVVGDICDTSLLTHLFSRRPPQIIYHAAALKHVWLMESNPLAAARTNILGTQRVLDAANAAGAERFVLVSTDKAAEPISFMGATKRVAELSVISSRGVVQANALRLGNVLGSTGSVVPMLERQMSAGGPLTITDRACTRYLLTIDEVVRHLLRSLLVEIPGSVLIPCTGAPLRILDLARFVVERAGQDIESLGLVYSGLRAGEKLSEVMVAADERATQSSVDQLQVIDRKCDELHLHSAIARIEDAVRQCDTQALLQEMTGILPQYQPSVALITHLQRASGKLPA
jgi:FlaA1/EpsC-like NDP-sugar epimerase